MWFVYLLECSDGSLYTGITKDVDRRLNEHNISKKGAKYTRSRRPVSLLCSWPVSPKRGDAMREELRIKKLSHRQKRALVERVCG